MKNDDPPDSIRLDIDNNWRNKEKEKEKTKKSFV